MSNSRESVQSRTSKWGWSILVLVSALILINGVALYFISASPSTFEQDTGVSMSEVRQTFPSVADHIVEQGKLISFLLAAFGLLALVVAIEGFRHGPRWAWSATWVLVAMLTGIFVLTLVVGGRLDIGGFYLSLAAIAFAGQLLARRR